MRLEGIDEIRGTLKLLTGLHIGAGDTGMHIGGADNQVVKNPYNDEPYIPGSSLKGKIRSLLEWYIGVAGLNNGGPMSLSKLAAVPDEEKARTRNLLKLFGCSVSDGVPEDIGPTRLSFRDAPLKKAWVEGIKARNLPLVEVKSENSINRIKGTAESPRQTERVPADAEFEFCFVLRRIEGDGESLRHLLFTGMKLLEMDSLGGSGSRGYGRVQFRLNDGLQSEFDKIDPWE